MEDIKNFKVDYLGVEVTRRCNLECAHCLRGERENKDIDDAILFNIFNGITEIGTLFLTGGEPFLVPERLERILQIIKEKSIIVHTISITTNATVLSQRQIDIIHRIENMSKLDIRFSHDKFHEIEQERKKISEKFKRNIKIFASLGYTNDNQHFSIDFDGIRNIGRAKKLNQELLDAVNQWKYPTNYKFNVLKTANTFDIMHLIYESPSSIRIIGNIIFDVNGNMVNNDMPYEKENKAPFFKISCKNKTILEAILEYEKNMNEANDDMSYDDYYKIYHSEQYDNTYDSFSKPKL